MRFTNNIKEEKEQLQNKILEKPGIGYTEMKKITGWCDQTLSDRLKSLRVVDKLITREKGAVTHSFRYYLTELAKYKHEMLIDDYMQIFAWIRFLKTSREASDKTNTFQEAMHKAVGLIGMDLLNRIALEVASDNEQHNSLRDMLDFMDLKAEIIITTLRNFGSSLGLTEDAAKAAPWAILSREVKFIDVDSIPVVNPEDLGSAKRLFGLTREKVVARFMNRANKFNPSPKD